MASRSRKAERSSRPRAGERPPTPKVSGFQGPAQTIARKFCLTGPNRLARPYAAQSTGTKKAKWVFSDQRSDAVRLRQADGFAELSAQDTGVGIPADELLNVGVLAFNFPQTSLIQPLIMSDAPAVAQRAQLGSIGLNW